jgi:Ca2+-transporting ATPase
VEKQTAALEGSELAIGDRKNMAYAGTVVTYGRGRGVVVATGMQTEFGKIAKLLQSVETGKTPLQKNLDKVGHLLARAAIVVVLLIVALGFFRGQPLLEMLIFGIALPVAIVPEALPVVYLPMLQTPVGTFSLPLIDWVIVIALVFTVSPVLELAKWMERRGCFGELT